MVFMYVKIKVSWILRELLANILWLEWLNPERLKKKMYFAIKHGDILASYVGLPEGGTRI